MTCEMCGNYGLYEMVTSNKPYGYSGTIPCFACKRYCNLSDKFVSKEKKIINPNNTLTRGGGDEFS